MNARGNHLIANRAADRRQILIVDDDIDFAESLADILEIRGYGCFIAHDPSEALKVIRSEFIHVALNDIRLGNTNGIDLIGQMKAEKPDLLCIVITAFAALETAINALQKGAYDYLRKPVEAHDLLATLDRCFEIIQLHREKVEAEDKLKRQNTQLEEMNRQLRAESLRAARALEQLRNSEANYKKLFENAPVGLIELDFSQVIASFNKLSLPNPKMIREYGDEHKDFMENTSRSITIMDVNSELLSIFQANSKKEFFENFTTLLASDGFKMISDAFIAIKKGQSRINGVAQYKTLKGRPVHILTQADFNIYGLASGNVMISCVDITERMNIHNDLEKEKAKFRSLVEEAPIGIAMHGPDGRYTYINPKRHETFGYSLEDCSTNSDFFLKAFPDPDYRQFVQKERESDFAENEGTQTFPRRVRLTCKDGSIKTILFRTMVLKSGDYLILSEDITPQVQLEDQIKQAQKMEAVGTLAGGIAHDFNNLLQAIQGYSQLLLIEKKQSDPETIKLQEIVKASQRANELTKQLLAFSRKVESKMRPVNLNKVIQQVYTLLQRTIPKMINIVLDLDENLQVVNADPIQMEQVVMNMAINARDAMPDGGTLCFKTCNTHIDTAYCQHHLEALPGSYVELTITDNGHGVDPRVIDHIFEPFFTTKGLGKGTGLGLSMVYGIVRSHKGQIECSSQPGVGTQFKILFPSIDQTDHALVDEPEEIIPPSGSESILIVDDEPLLQEIATAILVKFGYTVLSCPDGETALALLKGQKTKIDLVILDLIMPGMGGKRCLHEILALAPETKVVVASGYSGDSNDREMIEAKAKGFIRKPYDVHQMLKVIREILDQPFS